MYYFAYGSNMNHEQMKKRCPNSRFVETAYIRGYNVVFDGYSNFWKCSTANIVPNSISLAYGGLFEIDDMDLRILDGYEGYPNYYSRELVEVFGSDDEVYDSWVYIKDEERKSKPSLRYIKTVLDGAEDCRLPQDYCEWAYGYKFKNKHRL
ncbi:MAG: gamma-glutamylcyclotransferase [Candidatus Atribacteria bacterium]|nr:MAG: gamma-glutamylcyclotransferase [Candidatus Atribacteria bacterium]